MLSWQLLLHIVPFWPPVLGLLVHEWCLLRGHSLVPDATTAATATLATATLASATLALATGPSTLATGPSTLASRAALAALAAGGAL